MSRFLAINAQTNSANMGFNLINRYPRADFVCIDALEARLASNDRTGELTQIISGSLPAAYRLRPLHVTNGRHGSMTYERGDIVRSIPAFQSKVVDTMGAGDAVLAVAAPLVAVGAPLDLVGFIGNVVGAQKVEIVGHQPLDRPDLGDEGVDTRCCAEPRRIFGGPPVSVEEMTMSGITSYFAEFAKLGATARVTTAEGGEASLDDFVGWVIATARQAHAGGGKLMFVGNGGSSAIASHMAIDYSKNGGMRALAFNDSAFLTCLGNDLGYENVFAKPIDLFANRGDLLLAISSSGRSANILNAVETARGRGCHIATFSGFQPDNPLRRLGDYNLYVPASSYGFVEISHLAVCHCILDTAMGLGWGSDSERAAAE